MKEEIIGFVIYLGVSTGLFLFSVLRKRKNTALIILLAIEMLIGSFCLAVTLESKS